MQLVTKIERFQSRGHHLWKFIGTKESVYLRKEFNSHRISLEHQHFHRCTVLEYYQYGRNVKTLLKVWPNPFNRPAVVVKSYMLETI